VVITELPPAPTVEDEAPTPSSLGEALVGAHEALDGQWLVRGAEHEGEACEDFVGDMITISGTQWCVKSNEADPVSFGGERIIFEGLAEGNKLTMTMDTGLVLRARCRYDGVLLRMVRNEVPGGDFPDGFSTAGHEWTKLELQRAGTECDGTWVVQSSTDADVLGAGDKVEVSCRQWRISPGALYQEPYTLTVSGSETGTLSTMLPNGVQWIFHRDNEGASLVLRNQVDEGLDSQIDIDGDGLADEIWSTSRVQQKSKIVLSRI